MASSSSSSAIVPKDLLLPLIPCPVCGHDLVTYVAKKGDFPGHRFYKCIKLNEKKCPFFEFQDLYVKRMNANQLAIAGAVLAGHADVQVHHGYQQIQHHAIHPIQVQEPRPLQGADGQVLDAARLLLQITNLMISVLVLLFVVIIYLSSMNRIKAGHSHLHERLFSASGLPEHPQTISCIGFVLSAFNLLFP